MHITCVLAKTIATEWMWYVITYICVQLCVRSRHACTRSFAIRFQLIMLKGNLFYLRLGFGVNHAHHMCVGKNHCHRVDVVCDHMHMYRLCVSPPHAYTRSLVAILLVNPLRRRPR